MRTKILIAAWLILCIQIFPQRYLENELRGYTNPDFIVTLAPTLPFDEAVMLLSKVSLSATGKQIVSTVDLQEPIGLPIENMAYDKALVVLVQYKGLMYEEKEDVIVIKRKNEPPAVERQPGTYARIDEREVNIQAVIFQMDVNETKERGIDWKLMLSGAKGSIGSLFGIDQSQQQTDDTETGQIPSYNVDVSADFTAGNFFGEATAVFKLFENEGLGEIISSPNVSVRDGQKARLQVGQDISIKQRDFSGNIIENFFSTGTIIEVTPYIYKEEGLDYILCDIRVEKSDFQPSETQTIINKTEATTQVILLNGEETIIGGLFVNDEDVERSGVPILKDLPWWFLGLRYIFGSETTVIRKQELVILIKTELVPTLKERLAWPQSNSPLQDEVKKQRDRIKFHQFNESPTNGN